MGTERTVLKWRDLIIPTLEEIDDIIESFAIEQKLFTVRPLYHAIRAKYAGIPERRVTSFLKSKPVTWSSNVKFSNKPCLQPINSPRPNQRHQTDLVDLDKVPTETEGEYRYVLSVMDIFTR